MKNKNNSLSVELYSNEKSLNTSIKSLGHRSIEINIYYQLR